LNNLSDHSKLAGSLFDFNISGFNQMALDVFRIQAEYNPVYRQYVELMGVKRDQVSSIDQIPFLPVGFFKTHKVVTGAEEPEIVFESSGTTGMVNSRHHVRDLALYRRSFIEGFRQFYGNPAEWCIIGLLPSYLERSHSSLVYMVDELIRMSGVEESGFYLYEHQQLHHTILALEERKQKVMLIGVTFGLLDFAEQFTMRLEHTVVMETGGMKGRRQEMTRAEVHRLLTSKLGINNIHSEYGMTEMLSQGYSPGQGLFYPSRTMKVLVREEDDPRSIHDASGSMIKGIINVIDLCNIWSCSFIATDDAGMLYPDGSFEVTGRVDNSDIRGCSLMVV
jgi:hypothetical protein